MNPFTMSFVVHWALALLSVARSQPIGISLSGRIASREDAQEYMLYLKYLGKVRRVYGIKVSLRWYTVTSQKEYRMRVVGAFVR